MHSKSVKPNKTLQPPASPPFRCEKGATVCKLDANVDIECINELAQRQADFILKQFSSEIDITSKILEYDGEGEGARLLNLDHFLKIFKHEGLYAFSLQLENKFAIAYVGKVKVGGAGRIEQHLNGFLKNNETLRSVKTGTKHDDVVAGCALGYTVRVHWYSNLAFDDASLACIEIAANITAKGYFIKEFPEIEYWNLRN